MSDVLEQLSEWLQQNVGEQLSIKKGELTTGQKQLFDLDKVNIQLERISLISNQQSIDDYVPTQEMILHGEGKIQSDKGETYLPQNAYEIPLYGEINLKTQANRIQLETEKAIYQIQNRYHL